MCPLLPRSDNQYLRQRHLDEAVDTGAQAPKQVVALGNMHMTVDMAHAGLADKGVIVVICNRCTKRFAFDSAAVTWEDVYQAMQIHREESCVPGAAEMTP